MKRKVAYWIFQVAGWFLFILLNLLLLPETSQSTGMVVPVALLIFIYGLVSSHLFRLFILRFDLLRLPPVRLIPFFLLSSLLLGALFHFFQEFISVGLGEGSGFSLDGSDISAILNLALVYLVWSLIYFLVHFFRNFRKEEIKNLRLEAARSETELQVLRSQLNPHFLFNALNSIRALVDEDKARAREAITHLAGLLRSSLRHDREKLVPLREEVQLVKDYLALEMIRYEERLQAKVEIDEQCLEVRVPPMVLQLLVENAIKHGIAKLARGGFVRVTGKVENGMLWLDVVNSGSLNAGQTAGSGVGLLNTRERIRLLFGEPASLQLDSPVPGEVKATLKIPVS